MKSTESPAVIGVILVAFVCSLPVGCAGSRNAQEYPSVSSVPPKPGKPIEPPPEPPRVELFYGEGDCAPRFPNGMRGTCINNKPCSGFGIKDASGNLECDCFGVKGGCAEGLVCSIRKRVCVKPQEDEK